MSAGEAKQNAEVQAAVLRGRVLSGDAMHQLPHDFLESKDFWMMDNLLRFGRGERFVPNQIIDLFFTSFAGAKSRGDESSGSADGGTAPIVAVKGT